MLLKIWLICMFALAVSMVDAANDNNPLIQWVECKGTYLTVAFWQNSSFAKQTFEHMPLMPVDVHKKSDANSSVHHCGGGIFDGTNTVTFNYAACNASIIAILLPNYEWVQRVSLDLEASPPSFSHIPPVFVTVDCIYHTAYSVVAITDTLVKFKSESAWDEDGTNIPIVSVGAEMGFALRFNDSGYGLDSEMNPNYCFFSDSPDATKHDASVLPFIKNNCPDNSINDMGSTVVDDWEINFNYSCYLIKFKAFQYANSAQLYIHCLVNLCVDDFCRNATLDSQCPFTKWTKSGNYYPTLSAVSNDSVYSQRHQSQILASHRDILNYAATHSAAQVFKSGAVTVKL